MSCSSCSPTTNPALYVAPSTCGCGGLPSPRRVSVAPTVPVTLPNLGMARLASSGKLLMGVTGNEVAALDGVMSGPVVFDALTGKVQVGDTYAAAQVQDNFGCTNEDVSGFFLLGKNPGCVDIGGRPDRDIVVSRPANSTTGVLLGFNPVCSASAGQAQEMLPVKIAPGSLPDDLPEGLKMLIYRRVPAADDCTPATVEWYGSTTPLPVEVGDLDDYKVPDRELTPDDDDDFGFAIWVKVNGKWVLMKATNASVQALLGTNSPNIFIRPRPVVFQQVQVGGAAFLPVNTNINVTTLPNYDAAYTGITLTVELSGVTGTRNFDVYVQLDNEQFAQIKFGIDNAAQCDTNTVTVPIPASKQVNLKAIEYTDSDGTYNSLALKVYADAFVR